MNKAPVALITCLVIVALTACSMVPTVTEKRTKFSYAFRDESSVDISDIYFGNGKQHLRRPLLRSGGGMHFWQMVSIDSTQLFVVEVPDPDGEIRRFEFPNLIPADEAHIYAAGDRSIVTIFDDDFSSLQVELLDRRGGVQVILDRRTSEHKK